MVVQLIALTIWDLTQLHFYFLVAVLVVADVVAVTPVVLGVACHMNYMDLYEPLPFQGQNHLRLTYPLEIKKILCLQHCHLPHIRKIIMATDDLRTYQYN